MFAALGMMEKLRIPKMTISFYPKKNLGTKKKTDNLVL